MSKTLFFYPTLLSILFLFSACGKDDDPVIDDSTPNENLPANVEISTNVNGMNDFSFTFNECGFDDTNAQRSTNGYGTSGTNVNTRNNRTLITRIYNRDNNNIVTEELSLGIKFSRLASEGDVDESYMKSILDAELGTYSSENLTIDFNLKLNNQSFSNNVSVYDDVSEITYNSYQPDFEYTIQEYEVGYQIDCIDNPTIKMKGNFEGTFYAYDSGDVSDSLYLKIPSFEILLIID